MRATRFTMGLTTAVLATIAAAGTTAPAPGLSPDTALRMLRDGNARFVRGESTHPHDDAFRRHETSLKGQSPFAVVLACSDSRVPVETVFDRGVGDLFVIRIAGAICGAHEAASIEYGLGHLGAPMLVVLGHSGCGAVTAVATGATLHGNLPALADNIQPAVEAARRANPQAAPDDFVAAAIEANVWRSIEDLLVNSETIRTLVSSGTTDVVGAVYDLNSGAIRWMGEHPHQASLLAAPAAVGARNAAAAPRQTVSSHAPTPAAAHEPTHQPVANVPTHGDEHVDDHGGHDDGHAGHDDGHGEPH